VDLRRRDPAARRRLRRRPAPPGARGRRGRRGPGSTSPRAGRGGAGRRGRRRGARRPAGRGRPAARTALLGEEAGTFDVAWSLCQGALGTSPVSDPVVLAGLAGAVRPGGTVVVTFFHALFAARHLAPGDAFDPGPPRPPPDQRGPRPRPRPPPLRPVDRELHRPRRGAAGRPARGSRSSTSAGSSRARTAAARPARSPSTTPSCWSSPAAPADDPRPLASGRAEQRVRRSGQRADRDAPHRPERQRSPRPAVGRRDGWSPCTSTSPAPIVVSRLTTRWPGSCRVGDHHHLPRFEPSAPCRDGQEPVALPQRRLHRRPLHLHERAVDREHDPVEGHRPTGEPPPTGLAANGSHLHGRSCRWLTGTVRPWAPSAMLRPRTC
jgi:hypothetical protein